MSDRHYERAKSYSSQTIIFLDLFLLLAGLARLASYVVLLHLTTCWHLLYCTAACMHVGTSQWLLLSCQQIFVGKRLAELTNFHRISLSLTALMQAT